MKKLNEKNFITEQVQMTSRI